VIDMQSAMTTVGQTMTGNLAITGQADVDNIRINANTISTTNANGGLILAPDGTGTITLNAGTVAVPGVMSIGSAMVSNTLFMATASKIQANVTNEDVVIESNGTGSVVVDQVSISDNAITTHVSNADLKIGTDGTGAIDITTETIKRTGDMILDVSGDIYLDADGGDIFLKDGTAGTFAAFFRSGTNDLTISSSGTSALIFSDANVAAQGNLSVAGAQIDFTNLPTSDPGVAGRLYRDGATVKISL